MKTQAVGILPAAGTGSRLPSLRQSKELIPIALFSDPLTGRVKPMNAAEHSLWAMSEARVERCLVVINDRKPELLRAFGDGSEFGLNIAYINQVEPTGLAAAVDAAHPWTDGVLSCLALPDSIFHPRTALESVVSELTKSGADLVLGVFPTERPELLGPVRIANDGRVVEVLEKPPLTELRNTWGVAAWGQRFRALLRASVRPGISIGVIFNEAVQVRLDVRAVLFPAGYYMDLGTPESLTELVIRDRGLESAQKALVSRA